MKKMFLVIIVFSLIVVSGCDEDVSKAYEEISEIQEELEKISEQPKFNNESEKKEYCSKMAFLTTSNGYYNLSPFYDEEVTRICDYVILYRTPEGIPKYFKNMHDDNELSNTVERGYRETYGKDRTSPDNTWTSAITQDVMYFDVNQNKWIVLGNKENQRLLCEQLASALGKKYNLTENKSWCWVEGYEYCNCNLIVGDIHFTHKIKYDGTDFEIVSTEFKNLSIKENRCIDDKGISIC